MMAKLMRRGERIALERRRRAIARVAERMRELVGGASVAADEARVVVSGKGLVKRWLIDPQLRFLSGDWT